MRVRLPHSNGLFLSRWGTPLTDLRASVPDGKRFCPGKFVPVSKIEGNVPCLGAKSIHFVGYLPAMSKNVRSDIKGNFVLQAPEKRIDLIIAHRLPFVSSSQLEKQMICFDLKGMSNAYVGDDFIDEILTDFYFPFTMGCLDL